MKEGGLRFKFRFVRKYLKLCGMKRTPRNIKFFWSFTKDATVKVLKEIEDLLED